MFSVPYLALFPSVIYPMHLFTDQWHIFPVEPTMYIFYGIVSFANQTMDAALEIRTSIFLSLHHAPNSSLCHPAILKFDKANEE